MANRITLYQRLSTKGFPLVPVTYTKNGFPVADKQATAFYLRYRVDGKRKYAPAGSTVLEAENERKRMETRLFSGAASAPTAEASPEAGSKTGRARVKIADEAAIYIERSRQKAHKTYLGYKLAVNLFVRFCQKTYFDEISRDDALDFKHFLQTCVSPKTHKLLDGSTVFNTFLKVIVFLNDRGTGKYLGNDWLKPKDWPVNVDKKNKNKKYPVYTEEEVASLLAVSNKREQALIRFCAGSGFRIGEVAVTQWGDIDWDNKTVCVKTKPCFKFHPKDYEERCIYLPDTVINLLADIRGDASDSDLIFPSPRGFVDKHLEARVIAPVIIRANAAGNVVQKPKKPAHAFRVLYATRLHQQGVDIETIRQDLGHSDITTTQIYLRSANKQSDAHRRRINDAANFKSIAAVA